MEEKIKEFRKEAEKINEFVMKNADPLVAGHVQGYNSSLEEWLRETLEKCKN